MSRRGLRCAPRSPGHSIVQPFQSESPSALLSEIGNPFSWTRFLASAERGDRKRRHASSIRLELDEDAIRIFNQFLLPPLRFGANLSRFFFFSNISFEFEWSVFTASPADFTVAESSFYLPLKNGGGNLFFFKKKASLFPQLGSPRRIRVIQLALSC